MAKRRNQFLQERAVFTYDHASIASDATVKLHKFADGEKFRVERVTYVNPTGLAEDTTNVFNVKLIKGVATVLASHSTDSDLMVADAGIPANTFIDLDLSATDTDLVVVGGAGSGADTLSVFFDEGGNSTLPAGRLVIEGRYVQ